MKIFNKYDHIEGAIKVRIHRFFLHLNGKSDASFIKQNLFVGGVNNMEILSKDGFNAILDLRKEKEDNSSELQKYSIDYLSIKIPDRNVPTFDEAISVNKWIKTNLEKGKKIFVHCNLGRGRSPLVVCSFLISEGMSELDSIQLLKKHRKYVYLNSKQLKWLYEFKKLM